MSGGEGELGPARLGMNHIDLKRMTLRLKVMTIAMTCFVAFSASAEGEAMAPVTLMAPSSVDEKTMRDVKAGWCGPSCSWTLYTESGFLRIKGEGEMNEEKPWAKYSSSIKEVSITGLKSICAYAFDGCSYLENISIAESVVDIDVFAFDGCSSLETVDLPQYLPEIRAGLFADCTSLTSVTIPPLVKTIQDRAFSGCSALTRIVIPESVTSIGEEAFMYCESLESISIPEAVTEIGTKAFYESGLNSVIIPASVKSIENNSFASCSSLSQVFFLGVHDITNEDFLGGYGELAVCVPPDYESNSFLGHNVTRDPETCYNFQTMFNHCYYGDFVDSIIIPHKRKNATDWEKKTNNCAVFQCNNVTGATSWSECNSTDELNRICVDGLCMNDQKETSGQTIYVEIEVDPTKVGMIDTEVFKETLVKECKIDPDSIKVGWETDKEGKIFHVLVYVDDEETANLVKQYSEKCQR